jgi:hypothetical protein
MAHRSKKTVTLLASAARTATPSDAALTRNDADSCAVHVTINVSAVTATPIITPAIQGQDPASGSWYSILVGTAITATGLTVLKVGPGITAVANGAAADYLPAAWRLVLTHTDADSATYSVGAVLFS